MEGIIICILSLIVGSVIGVTCSYKRAEQCYKEIDEAKEQVLKNLRRNLHNSKLLCLKYRKVLIEKGWLKFDEDFKDWIDEDEEEIEEEEVENDEGRSNRG